MSIVSSLRSLSLSYEAQLAFATYLAALFAASILGILTLVRIIVPSYQQGHNAFVSRIADAAFVSSAIALVSLSGFGAVLVNEGSTQLLGGIIVGFTSIYALHLFVLSWHTSIFVEDNAVNSSIAVIQSLLAILLLVTSALVHTNWVALTEQAYAAYTHWTFRKHQEEDDTAEETRSTIARARYADD